MKKITVEIEQHYITILVTVVCLLYGVTFLAGYFWGKKSALEEFSEQIKNESFSDKVYASLCSMYEQPEQAISTDDTQVAPAAELEISDEEKEENTEKQEGQFVAQLIGYGTQEQAKAYLKSLERKHVAAHVVTRTSVSARGKKRVWYQVVTNAAPYDATVHLVERLTAEDKLAGVTIVEETAPAGKE